MNHSAGASLIPLFFVGLLVAGLLGMYVVSSAIPNNSSPGTPPRIQLMPNEKFVHVTRMTIAGNDYSLWDIRDNRSGIFKFMTLVTPNDGVVVRDPDVQAKAFSIRLALQTALVVKSIVDKAGTVETAAASVVKLGGAASYAASILGEYSIARDINEFVGQMGQRTAATMALVTTLNSSAEYADRLIKNPNEQNADTFMASLGASAISTYSQRATFVYLILTNALEQIGITAGPWLESLYNYLTRGANPTIIVVGSTFGAYETSITTRELESRVIH